jgi:hypothetical protein
MFSPVSASGARHGGRVVSRAVREPIEFILEARGKWADVKNRTREVRNFNI